MAKFRDGNLILKPDQKVIQAGVAIIDENGSGEFAAIKLRSGAQIDEISIDGTLTRNSDDVVPTERAVKTYVDANAGTGSERYIYYDSWVQVNNVYPTTESLQIGINQKYAPFVVNNFSLFGDNCKWEVHNFVSGVTTKNLTFSTVSDIVDYKNNNVPRDIWDYFETVVFRPYDTIDENIPVIDKLYGMNRLFGALKGSRNYKSGKPHCGNMSPGFTKGGEILKAMFDSQFPSFASFMTAADFLTGNGKYAMWLPKNGKKMYGIPHNNSILKFWQDAPHYNGRYYFDENWEGPNPIPSPSRARNFYLTDAKICTWDGTTRDTGSAEVIDLYKTGSGGIEHITEINITPSGNATQNSLDNNLATWDTIFLGTNFEYRWSTGTKKINKCEIILSTNGDVISADLDFYYIPPGETNISNYIKFYTYNYTGGILTNELITAEIGRAYEWCDGIYIIASNLVGEGDTTIKEFDAYEYMKYKTILPFQNRIYYFNAFMYNVTSNVICFKAIDPYEGEGEREFVVYIKPLGIDVVYLNNVDFTKYDLEAVFFNKDKQKSMFKVISQSQVFNNHPEGDQIGLPKDVWLPPNDLYQYCNGGSKRMPDVYFRLRDKTTKKVGNLSRAKINAQYDQGPIPMKWMVV